MNRTAALLAAIGATLVVVAVWLYSNAETDRIAAEARCWLGGASCCTSINWAPIIATGVAGAAAIIVAWRMRSVENESAEDLVG